MRAPIAQTFTLTEGRCVTGVRLKCARKGAPTRPVFVQIRPVDGGEPTGEVIAESFNPGTDVTAGQFFKARFSAPTWLESGRPYAIVVLTDDADHALAIGQMGKIDQDNRIVTAQPFVVGVMLSSSNAQTWTVHQDIDLVFELLAARFEPLAKSVIVGTFHATKMSDIIVSAGVEYPDSQVSIVLKLTRPNGKVITASPDQRIRLTEFIQNETIQVTAELTGTATVTPFLYPGVQIVEGELQASASYASRRIPADNADRVTVTFDALLPAGSGVAVQIGELGDYAATAVHAATPLGDGIVEQTYQRKPYAPDDARTLITLSGTPAARPSLSKLRMVTTEI